MNVIRSRIQPFGAKLVSSDFILNLKRSLSEYKRRLKGAEHQVDVYLRINDPYSALLVQVLPQLEKRYAVNIGFTTILNLQDDMYPEPQMWHDNAFVDCGYLAALYGLGLVDNIPQQDDETIKAYTSGLMALEKTSEVDWSAVKQLFTDYWQGRGSSQVWSAADDQHIHANEQRLATAGHYMSAMLNYAGEWYWGLDRLDHLEQRLNELGLSRSQPEMQFDKTWQDFCQAPALQHRNSNTAKFTLYFSIRSPYSHLGLERAMKLAEHYQLDFEIKPVLPMIMRGLKVPNTKKMYIFHDTKREAKKLNIDYGFVADPLGEGVVRCYALFKYAQEQGVEKEYLLNYAQAVNAQGILSETDAGLKIIVERSGLDWSKAQQILSAPGWREGWQEWAEANRNEMIGLGQWGVPSVRYRDLMLWGQDRIGFVEAEIRKDLSRN